MIAGWEIIAQLSALIPLLLHIRPKYSPQFKHRFNFHIFESFSIKIEITLAHFFKSFRQDSPTTLFLIIFCKTFNNIFLLCTIIPFP